MCRRTQGDGRCGNRERNLLVLHPQAQGDAAKGFQGLRGKLNFPLDNWLESWYNTLQKGADTDE
jgi:hypothetical protein